MRLISFKNITIKNFLSVGSTPVSIAFTPGVNAITGVNYDKEDSKNGVGKSTIVDALYFALFGTTVRELNKDLIVNSTNKKNCEVTLELQSTVNNTTVNYKIVRSLQPTKCSITKDGVDITRSTLAKTNEFIQELIKSTGKVFQHSVIMSINNTVPFMAQSKVDKRKFIESVLNLEMFSDMLLKARDEYNEIKKEYEIVHTNNETLKKEFTFNSAQLTNFETGKNKKLEELDRKITDYNSKIDTLRVQLTELPNNIDTLLNEKEKIVNSDLEAARQTVFNLQLEKNKFESEIKRLNKQIKEIDEVGSVCTTCNRAYSDEDISHKEENKNNLKAEIAANNDELILAKESVDSAAIILKSKEEAYNAYLKQKQGINDIKSKNLSTNTKISSYQESIDDYNNEKTNIANETNTLLENKVQELNRLVTESDSKLSNLDNELSVLECVKFVVSEDGVKSYIVKKILKILNARLAYYLNELHANCNCSFDEYFDEVITDEKNETKSYFNFSGGERKRIDLACLFAFLDIRRMQGDVHFSTIFYDELLDSSLDDKGVELVFRVLKDRQSTYNENCYIISHRAGNILAGKVDSTIFLEKRNGFTTLS